MCIVGTYPHKSPPSRGLLCYLAFILRAIIGRMIKQVGPTQIVILGGSGDLSRRKLIPALMDLYAKELLPDQFRILGIARTERTDEDYQQFVIDALKEHKHGHSVKTIEEFCKHISYVSGAFDEADTFREVKRRLGEYEDKIKKPSNRVFYLAVPPATYGVAFNAIKDAKAAPKDHHGCWSRILVEKPFGNDLDTAQALDTLLGELFDESQIFRIDHYLAKESVQNILSFRFANTLLQTAWNKDAIESVCIEMKETLDVGNRVNFYEGVGALRDVGQNHLLQLLALIAMDEPKSLEANDIRTERTKVLEALKRMTKADVAKKCLRAQYKGYRGTHGVREGSTTETYFEIEAELDLPNWQGVPFYIKAGKALDENKVEVTITFKEISGGPFKTSLGQSAKNKVRLTISPEQEMGITLNAKEPGLGLQLESRELSFVCDPGKDQFKNSYQKVLYDCILGDHTLFTRTEEVLASWRFITPIIDQWQDVPLYTYSKGSAGPNRTLEP